MVLCLLCLLGVYRGWFRTFLRGNLLVVAFCWHGGDYLMKVKVLGCCIVNCMFLNVSLSVLSICCLLSVVVMLSIIIGVDLRWVDCVCGSVM